MRLRTCASCLAAPALFGALSLASLAGCSSSSSGSGDGASTADAVPTADNGLAGQYVADDTTSAFSSITFVDDTRYILQPTTCPDSDDCREQGWYTLTGDEVALHDDLGDPVQTFELAVLSGGIVPTAVTDDGGTDSDAGVTVTMTEDESTTPQSLTVARGTDSLVGSGSSLFGSGYQVYSLLMRSSTRGSSSYHLVNSTGQLVNASNASTLVTPTTGPLVGTSILFEGTCSFLHSCSSFSKKLPAGEVSWGCTGVQACSDTTHWLAGPSRSYCGKTVTVCKGTTCTTGTVLDVSSAGSWEGSEGLLGAVGLPYGLTGTCSGYGGGMVTIHD